MENALLNLTKNPVLEFIKSPKPDVSKSKNTIATICSGGGILEAGAIYAGLKPIWGIDNDPNAIDSHYANFESFILNKDLTEVEEWSAFKKPTILHASPSCKNFSQANTKKESLTDIEVAWSIARAIKHLQPDYFTLENVAAYITSKSFNTIEQSLIDCGYRIETALYHLNQWGVPQQRKRFIVIANRKPNLTLKTEYRTHLSWWNAIEDLVPTFTESSELTSSQSSHILSSQWAEIKKGEPCLIRRNQLRGLKSRVAVLRKDDYAWTVTAEIASDGKGNSRRKFADIAIDGKFYSLTPRAMARLQTVPDWYELPDRCDYACRIVGNGVPSYFAYQFFNQLLNHEN